MKRRPQYFWDDIEDGGERDAAWDAWYDGLLRNRHDTKARFQKRAERLFLRWATQLIAPPPGWVVEYGEWDDCSDSWFTIVLTHPRCEGHMWMSFPLGVNGYDDDHFSYGGNIGIDIKGEHPMRTPIKNSCIGEMEAMRRRVVAFMDSLR